MNAGEIKANSKTNGEITGANEANLSATPHANLSAKNPRTNLNPSAPSPNAGANLNAPNLDATPHVSASQRELEGSIDFSQLEKSDFTPNFTQVNKIVGNGFLAKDGDLIFLDEAKFDLSKSLQNKSGLNERVNASLAWLQSRHPEMFKNKIAVKKVIDYVLDDPSIIKSAKNENNIFMGKMNGEKMNDIVINKDESKIIHANTRKPNAKEKADSEDALHSHSDTLPDGALMLAEKPRLSANGEILPQNADNFAQNLDQSAQNLSNANLNAPNLPNANFHNPRAEFSANNAYENFSNPNNPRFMNGGGGENPRFMPYSPSQNPRANARGQEERTDFLNGEHLGAKEASLMNGSVDFTHLKKADFPPNSSANLAFENSQDALTWRAANGANVGENLKPNGANTARTNEAQNGANLGANEVNLGSTNSRSANGANLNEANLRNANQGTNTARTNQSTDEANLRARQEAHAKAQQEAINEQEHLNANSLTNDTRANEANLRAQQEANSRSANSRENLGSADTTKAKLTKEQNEAQKLLKQILKALKTSPTKKPFSISAGEKQTWENAINEKLKELKEKEQILKEQPSANFGEVPHTLAQPSLNLNALEKMKFSLSQEAALKAKIKAQKAKLEERANKNLEALIKKEQTAHTKTSQEVQQQALQDAGEAEEKLGALLDYAKSKENKARNFINSLLLRSTLGAGYGALANKDDRLKGAMIGAGAGAIGIPLLRALPHNFTTTMTKNALSGGVIGATSDSDNRVRGAMIGALAGAGGVPLALKVAGKLGAKANYNQNLREAMLDLHKNKGWRNIDDSFGGLIKRNFSDTLGGEYRELESQMNANINKQIYHLQDTFKSLSNLSEDARREAHLYLSGELDKSVNLEPNLKAQLDNLRKSLDDNQRTLYELGRLERPLKGDEVTNSWLHRIYDKNKDGNFVFAGEAKTIEDIKTRGKVWKMDEEDFIKQINSGKIDVSLFNKPLYEGGIRATKTAQGKIELRRDWTFEERTKMGEIRDVAQTLPLSLIHQVRLIEQAKFLKAVSTLKVDGVDILKGAKEIENLKATFGEEEFKEVLKKQGFSQIPDDKKFGALRGRFVRSDIKDDLVGKFDSFRSNWSETAKVASDTWLQINKLMKKSKTIYNPVTHVNNIASNIAFLKMQGVSNPEITSGLKEYYSLMKKAPLYQDLRIKALENQATSEDLARLNELKKEFGIYDSAQEVGLFGKSDLNDMSKDNLFTKDNLIARGLNKTRIFGENSLISKTANKFDDWISDIYQGEDNVMRYVAFASHYNYTNEIRQQKWKIWTNIGPNFMKSYRKLYKSSNKKYFLSTVPL